MKIPMDETAEQFWNRVAPKLRRHMGLVPPTMEEAQALLDALDPEECVPLTDEEVERIVCFATTGKKEK